MEENKGIFELNPEDLEQVTGGKNQKVIAKKGGKKIHSGPGETFAVVAKTTAGAIAYYTGEMKYVKGEAWIHVKWNDNKSGWILAKDVELI